MLRRTMGIIMIVIGLAGVVISVAGAIFSRQLIDDVGGGLESSLVLTTQSLDTVIESLVLTRTMIGQVNGGLVTVEETTVDLARTVNETRPLLKQVAQVASREVPDSIEAVQMAIPNMAHVAGTIDTTLHTLSNLQVEQRILGVPLRFDLGIEYDPAVPFDESVNQLGSSLDGLPERLRALEIYLNVTDTNLSRISRNLYVMAGNLGKLNGSVTEVEPLLDEYIRLVTEANDSIRQTRADMVQRLRLAKSVVTIVFVWVGLTQVAPLYLGLELLTGRRDPQKERMKDEG